MILHLSAWAVQAYSELPNLEPIVLIERSGFNVEARLGKHALWLVYHWQNGIKTAFSTVYSAVGSLTKTKIEQEHLRAVIHLKSEEATYKITLEADVVTQHIIRWTTNICPKLPLLLPFSPKDIFNFTSDWKPLAIGKVHVQQVGNRSGALFYSLNKPQTGTVLYFQNLSSLNAYFNDTETTGSDLVGGNWPEIGFSLPPTNTEALKEDKTYVISDAVVSLSSVATENDREVCTQYLTQLAQVYPFIKRPEPIYHNWLETVENGLKDLAGHAGCWTFADGNHYLNAYVSDYDTPPEIMVQLAVLLPLIEYAEWKGQTNNELIDRLKAGLPAFYKKDMGTVVRWLPKLEKQLDHSEEQKKPNVMDS